MKNPDKHNNDQRSFGDNRDEWWRGLVVKGTDVFCAGSGRVREEWRSGCAEERALTGALMAKIAEPSILVAALRQVVSNKGSAGVDGMSVQELKTWFSSHWKDLQAQLLEGTYQVAPVHEVQIPKPKGGYRTLGIPTVKDRMVQEAISQVLSKRYEPVFSDHSHGFRPGHSAHGALRQAGNYVAEGREWVVASTLRSSSIRSSTTGCHGCWAPASETSGY